MHEATERWRSAIDAYRDDEEFRRRLAKGKGASAAAGQNRDIESLQLGIRVVRCLFSHNIPVMEGERVSPALIRVMRIVRMWADELDGKKHERSNVSAFSRRSIIWFEFIEQVNAGIPLPKRLMKSVASA